MKTQINQQHTLFLTRISQISLIKRIILNNIIREIREIRVRHQYNENQIQEFSISLYFKMKQKQTILNECNFKTARSGGAGGQHVNKVETKAIIIFNVKKSIAFNELEKERIELKLKNKINKDGELVIAAQTYKSQIKNKKLAEEKLIFLLENALKEPKKRKKTKISKAAKERRLKVKQIKSDHKKNRRKIRF